MKHYWIGKEKEGKHRGVKTLFIKGLGVKFIRIAEILEQNQDIKQLYFGAGNCSFIKFPVLEECMKKYPHLMISAEMKIGQYSAEKISILKKVDNLICTINHGYFYMLKDQKSKVQIKLQTLARRGESVLMMTNMVNFIEEDIRDLKGEKYESDVYIGDKDE